VKEALRSWVCYKEALYISNARSGLSVACGIMEEIIEKDKT